MFIGLLALGLIGFLIGWAMRAKSIISKLDRLEKDTKSANEASANAKRDAEKYKKTNSKLENQIKGLQKRSAPREEFDSMRTRLTSAEGDVDRLRKERDSAQHQLEGFRETSVSGAEVSELKRELERNQSQVRKLKARSEKKKEEIKVVQSKEVHDLVGFKNGRDTEVKDLTLENVRLREILNKVQTGDKKSLLQLADEARTGSAKGDESEDGSSSSATSSGEVTTLRSENERLNAELEIAKKKLLSVKGAGGSAIAGGAAFGLERERDQLKVELAKARATGGGGGSSDAESVALKSEVAALKKSRDQLTIRLAEAERSSSLGKPEAGSSTVEASSSEDNDEGSTAKAVSALASGAAAVAGATAVVAVAAATGDVRAARASAAGARTAAAAIGVAAGAAVTNAKAGGTSTSNVTTPPQLVARQPRKAVTLKRPWPNNIPNATRIRQRLWDIHAVDSEDIVVEEKVYPLGELALDRQPLTTRF